MAQLFLVCQLAIRGTAHPQLRHRLLYDTETQPGWDIVHNNLLAVATDGPDA